MTPRRALRVARILSSAAVLLLIAHLVAAGKLFVGADVTNDGTMDLHGPVTQFHGNIAGAGTINIGDGSTVDFRHAVGAGPRCP